MKSSNFLLVLQFLFIMLLLVKELLFNIEE